MKIALICPSNMLFMPYVGNYEEIIKEIQIDYDIIYWDRFGIESNSEFVYQDFKVGHKRNIIDYYKYSKFVSKILKKYDYDKVIVFGLQLIFFLQGILTKKYRNNYIIDIRDYHKIINYLNIKKIILKSTCTVLSSPGFTEWLPKSDKYIVNHNTKIKNIAELTEPRLPNFNNKKISIGCIGALRDYKINVDFIQSLKNNVMFQLNYHGEGDINKNLILFIKENNIQNVNCTGRYDKNEEKDLYLSNDFINILWYNDGINNKLALPNRLYNSVIYGKPIITFDDGTFLSEIIRKYHLGLVISSFNNVEQDINNYLSNFDIDIYNSGRKQFINNVINDNKIFKKSLIEFISDKIGTK